MNPAVLKFRWDVRTRVVNDADVPFGVHDENGGYQISRHDKVFSWPRCQNNIALLIPILVHIRKATCDKLLMPQATERGIRNRSGCRSASTEAHTSLRWSYRDLPGEHGLPVTAEASFVCRATNVKYGCPTIVRTRQKLEALTADK